MGDLTGHFRIACLAAALVAAGCAGPRAPAPTPPPFPSSAAVETFTAGYANISEKFIEPVSIADLAIEGMRGLGSIDPALTVRREGDSVVVAATDGEVGRFVAPVDDDISAWAGLTAETARIGRDVSQELNRAPVEKIYEAVFDGILSKLDRYSHYAGREEAARNRAKRDGFGGIGIRFQTKDDSFAITEVMDETPAAAAGLAEGDVITHVDGLPTAGLASKDVIDRLRGPVATHVVLTIARPGFEGPLTFDIARAHIIPTTVTDRFDEGALVLAISQFNQGTSATVSRKIRAAAVRHGRGLKGVVLDLRGNPGGLLKQAIQTADLFLTQGEIIRTLGRHPDSVQYYEADGSDLVHGLPVVVVVDGRSASAAEVAAAALQDRGRGLVVGTTSYGKGTVQTVIRLPNDGEVTLTWSRFVTPSGYVLHDLGVRPTVCTSGATADGPDPVFRVLAHHDDAAVLAAWRTVAITDEARRQELRASCPAQRRQGDADVGTARRLIMDQGLYARLIGFSNTAAAAVPQ